MKIKHNLNKSMQIIINYKLYYVCSKTAEHIAVKENELVFQIKGK